MVLIIFNCFGNGSGTDMLYDTYDKEPFYAVLFSIALLILLIGYFRRRRFDSENTPILNLNYELQQFDVLGQPQTNLI